MRFSNEAREAAIAKLQGAEAGDPGENTAATETEEVVEREASTRAEDVEAQTDEKPEGEEASTSPDTDEDSDGGHAVPYQRFKRVIDQKNEASKKVSAYEARIQELQAELEKAKKAETAKPKDDGSSDDWLDSLFSDDEDEEASVEDPRVQNLEQRLQAFELKQAEEMLLKELRETQEEFPDVPEEILLRAIEQNPSASMRDVANQWSTWTATIEERAIARHLKKSKSTPPRPSSRSGGATTRSNVPSSREEARRLMREKIAKQMGL
jgi:hypothetical protein